ncbi:hypothetical protein HH308_24950 [Gordonia sp. TBRC 11910]|uniref:Uncharacterized protein n=1 Tax=Gordonia asplenii TaxID=2725283 RepID=A0A848L7K9_9ACTN|nr:hypothetical protein [Gordonia asplenii]NMO04471.1 hypothetical protein [Gordonia asplenii]
MTTETTLWPPAFFELGSGEHAPADRVAGHRSWYVRCQNFVTVVTRAAAGEILREEPASDEHLVLVLDGAEVDVTARDQQASASGPALVVVPAGPAQVRMRRSGDLIRIFTSRSPVASKAANAHTYATTNPQVTPLPPASGEFGTTLRVVPLADVPEVPGRHGRIFRTDSLMVNWPAPIDGPRDTDTLTPHAHDDFEQAVITVEGDFVHHIRRPWTARMRDWRPDEHVQITSPSVTIIPPGNVHTSRWVGRGGHQLIDVFAPARADFIEQGWVLNQKDYE